MMKVFEDNRILKNICRTGNLFSLWPVYLFCYSKQQEDLKEWKEQQ